MFSEIIKLIPTVDRAALGRMFTQLNQRFGAVAKKFGAGLQNALKLGGVVGVGLGLLSKLLNPLEKAEAIIDRIAGMGDDAVANADEFQSDPGKLLRLQALGETFGLDPDTMRTLLGKFQAALSKEQDAAAAPARLSADLSKARSSGASEDRIAALEAQLESAKKTAAQGGLLNNFIGETDMADAFFQFIQALQKLEPAQRTVIQGEIFGEKIRGRASEFFNSTKDYGSVLAGLPSVDALSAAAKRSAEVADEKDRLGAITKYSDFVGKSGLINVGQAQAINRSNVLALRGEDETLKRFDQSKNASIAIQELTSKFDRFATDFVNNVAPQLVTGINTLTKLASEFLPSFQEAKTFVDEKLTKIEDTAISAWGWMESFWDSAGDKLEGASESFSTAVKAVEGYWAEFKSGPIYRTFGGGGGRKK